MADHIDIDQLDEDEAYIAYMETGACYEMTFDDFLANLAGG